MDIINTTPKISIRLELKLTAVLSIYTYPQTKKWNFCIMLQRISDSANASPVLGEGRLKNELFLLYYSQCPTKSGFNLKFFTTSKNRSSRKMSFSTLRSRSKLFVSLKLQTR